MSLKLLDTLLALLFIGSLEDLYMHMFQSPPKKCYKKNSQMLQKKKKKVTKLNPPSTKKKQEVCFKRDRVQLNQAQLFLFSERNGKDIKKKVKNNL